MTTRECWRQSENGRFLMLRGNPNRVVHLRPTARGYLFVFGKKAGYLPTIEEAKDYVGACAELGRWAG